MSIHTLAQALDMACRERYTHWDSGLCDQAWWAEQFLFMQRWEAAPDHVKADVANRVRQRQATRYITNGGNPADIGF